MQLKTTEQRYHEQGTVAHWWEVDAVVHVAEGQVERAEGQHHALALLRALQLRALRARLQPEQLLM